MSVKYRFEIHYQTNSARKISEFMRKCDLDIGDICFVEVYTFTASKRIKIDKIKEKFIEGFKQCECEILKIEGGIVE